MSPDFDPKLDKKSRPQGSLRERLLDRGVHERLSTQDPSEPSQLLRSEQSGGTATRAGFAVEASNRPQRDGGSGDEGGAVKPRDTADNTNSHSTKLDEDDEDAAHTATPETQAVASATCARWVDETLKKKKYYEFSPRAWPAPPRVFPSFSTCPVHPMFNSIVSRC
jgi:hypothetical protein